MRVGHSLNQEKERRSDLLELSLLYLLSFSVLPLGSAVRGVRTRGETPAFGPAVADF